jgi:outer membrane protein, multidrug efflux system
MRIRREKYYSIIYFILIAITFPTCKTPQLGTETPMTPVPQAYNTQKDSTNSADINWKKYFTDSTLTKLIDTALKNNLDLLITLQRIEAARANVKLTRGMLLPSITGNIAAGQRRFGRYTMDGAGNRTTEMTPGQIVPTDLPDFYAGLQSSWELDVWGKLRNKRKAAAARYLASIEGKNWVVTNLIAEMASTYYELLALDIELEIIKETIVLQNNQLSIIKIEKEAGRANELAVKQFEGQLYNSQSLEIEVLQSITETENKLNFLMGRYPQPIQRDKLTFNRAIPTQILIGIPAELLKNRPDIRQAEYELIASRADVKAARAAFYPSLTITAGVGFQAFDTRYLFSPQSLAYNALGSLTAPLINQSAIKAQFRTAKAAQLQALYAYQRSILNGYVEVYNQMNNISNLEKIYTLKNNEVAVLSNGIETASELYLTGRATYLEIVITRKNALQSRLELIEIKRRQYNSVINIYKALGGGWE